MIDKHVAQAFPREDVEAIIPVVLNFYEGHNEAENGTRFSVSNDLAFAVEGDVAILRDVTELPGRSAACFHLAGDMLAGFIGRNDVIVRDVAGKRGSDQSPAGEFRRYQVLTSLPDKFIATTCCHIFSLPDIAIVPRAASLSFFVATFVLQLVRNHFLATIVTSLRL